MQNVIKTISNLLFWLLVLLIIGTTVFPRAILTEVLHFNSNVRLDYLFHFLSFLPFPTLAYFASQDNLKLKKWKLMLTIAFVLSFLAETIQLFAKDRTFNLYDVLANLLGLIIGLLLVFAFNKWVLVGKKG